MSEFVDDGTTVEDPNPMRELREAHEQAVADAKAARQENTILKAGLTLSDKQVNALVASHDGDWTPEAIKETATELGFVKGETPDEAPAAGPTAEDEAAAARIAEATAGAPPASPPAAGEQALKEFRDRLYSNPQGSGSQVLAAQQAEAERILAEAGGSVVSGTIDIGPIVPQ